MGRRIRGRIVVLDAKPLQSIGLLNGALRARRLPRSCPRDERKV
jgi:hypothetical protein